METKIIVEVQCIHCGGAFTLQKPRLQRECQMQCPECWHELHLLFDTSINPQPYSFLPVDNSPAPAGKPTVVKGRYAPDSHETQRMDPPAQEAVAAGRKTELMSHRLDDPSIEYVDCSSTENPWESKGKTERESILITGRARRHNYRHNPAPETVPEYSQADSYLNVNNDNSASQNPPLRNIQLFLTRRKLWGLISERYQLVNTVSVVGRYDADDPSDISIQGDETISRRSFSIEVQSCGSQAYKFVLKVLNAANPVKVNGHPFFQGSQTTLNLGDEIVVGRTHLTFSS